MIKNVLIVVFSSAYGIGTTFIRGVILARILGPHQFGLAIIVISVTTALDMFADAGIDKFVVQSRFGHRSDVMRTSHAFRIGGSSVVGLAIALLSYPVAIIFHAPDIWLPIALTGGVVTLRGLVNLSYKLQQRKHRFESETIIDTSRFTADLAVTAIVALLTHSFWCVIAGAYVNAMVHLAMSHGISVQRYSFRPRRQLISLVGRFSTPIYINAAILLAAVQGDRLVVAAMFSKSELALYAAASAIGQGIVGFAGKITTSMLLPIMCDMKASFLDRKRQTNLLGVAFILASLAFVLGMSTLGPTVVRLLYGKSYAGLTTIIFAAAIVHMIQIEQGWLTTLLMANGLTAQFPLITIMRATAFPIAILFVSLGYSILAIPMAFALGTAMSLAASYYASRSLHLIDRRIIVVSYLRIFATIGAVALLARK